MANAARFYNHLKSKRLGEYSEILPCFFKPFESLPIAAIGGMDDTIGES
jgi:hypothetical protein